MSRARVAACREDAKAAPKKERACRSMGAGPAGEARFAAKVRQIEEFAAEVDAMAAAQGGDSAAPAGPDNGVKGAATSRGRMPF